jgi:hypothetical protein
MKQPHRYKALLILFNYQHLSNVEIRPRLHSLFKSNVYLKNILPSKDCLKKSYIPGGWSAPYFAVGFESYDKDGNRYTGRYIYIPVKENANRLTWNDSSDTQIYAISVSGANKLEDAKPSSKEIRKNFNEALNAISRIPALYEVIGKHLFVDILKKNKL